jgi:hypothetical protein
MLPPSTVDHWPDTMNAAGRIALATARIALAMTLMFARDAREC